MKVDQESVLPLFVSGLSKIYPAENKHGQSFTAVDDISFSLKKNQILGLLGPNGAGKSTTISMLLGSLTPTTGEIKFFGQDLATHSSSVMQNVAFASTYIKMPWRLTIMENLRIYGLLYGVKGQVFERRVEKYLKFFEVWNQRHKTVNDLSAGQITRIMLAKAFLSHPKIALLDEPTASLDPDIAHQVREFVKQQRSEYGVSVLYTSHNMDEVADVCDEVMFLKQGKIVATDKPENLASSIKVARLRLMVKDGLKRIIKFAGQQNLPVKEEGREVVLEINEKDIAEFLARLAKEKIEYTQITIDKPTLEDYFLEMSK